MTRHFNDEVKLPTWQPVFAGAGRGNSTIFETRTTAPQVAADALKEKCREMDRNTQQEEIKAHLMQTDEHFRKLVEQHREYDRLVDELERKPALSTHEEVEEHRLKKLKLHLRDEIERLMSEHGLQHAG